MKNIKNKNIFDNFHFKTNSLSIKNIISFYGNRVIDLFTHYPLSVKHNNYLKKLDSKHTETFISVDVTVLEYQRKFHKKSPFKVICQLENMQKIDVIFFNMNEYQIKNYLKINDNYRISGKLGLSKDSFQMIHPTSIINKNEINYFDPFEPQYDLSRKKINKKNFRKTLKDNLDYLKLNVFPDEWINKDEYKKEWISFKESLIQIHSPQNKNELKRFQFNRERLAFDELLSSYLTFFELKRKFSKNLNFNKIEKFQISKDIINKLPFNLTSDQKKSLIDIKKDLSKNEKMYRLIQGDVGCGKTIIALLIVAEFLNNGFQVVIMSPTEILAKQHYDYFKKILYQFKFNIELITGSVKDKKKIYNEISQNKINLLIGTHSVYNKSIKFKKLGLIVIDEQHKFGVNQRINLLEKSENCHTLIMSATPIPRSLSFAIYGEISISNIKTKPKGRKKIVTSIISTAQINNLINGIKRKIAKNEQVFWILPTIGSLESEKQTLITRFNYLKEIFKEHVSYIHGKMNKNEIDKTMNNFQKKEIMILVSTTVIEVGINIPDASLMIIEQAERFGLAQLHQLRGRISRSNLHSNCVLIHNNNLSEISKERLLIIKNNEDGFEIAEKDLILRGAGDFFGTNQSGLPLWRFFIPNSDYKLITSVKKNSEYLLQNYKLNEEKINFLKKIFYKERNIKNFFSV